MAQQGEFKIKGAAVTGRSSNSKTPPAGSPHSSYYQSMQASEASSDAAAKADKDFAGHEQGRRADDTLSQQELLAKHKWFKCQADPEVYGKDQYYWTHSDTKESRWVDPEQPYWLYDEDTGYADLEAGLQYPVWKPSRAQVYGLHEPATEAPYTGYNPRIHGDYDPNADYAQYHNQKRAEEAAAAAAAADPYGLRSAAVPGGAAYGSTMTFNRFSGNAQAAGINPERHSDASKSARQMNAFFDVDAAANAHEGRSLKEERKSQKYSKEQIKTFNKTRRDKKEQKRRDFLMS